jgi:exodeoxyribonuclease-1
MSAEELAKHWGARFDDELEPLPVKTMQYNHCPAIAPVSVLDEKSKKRIAYDEKVFMKHAQLLQDSHDFVAKLEKALDILEDKQQTAFELNDDVDTQLYDGFWGDRDRADLIKIRQTDPDELSGLIEQLSSERMRKLLPLYKARNYPKALTSEERQLWESRRRKVFYDGGENSKVAKFSQKLIEITRDKKLTSDQQYLLSELQLYVESILPDPAEDELIL